MRDSCHPFRFILHPSSFILCVLAVSAAAQIAAVRPGHTWGDDFALYILHARNIVQGRPYGDTGYIYNPRTAIVGPRSYPPLTSWLLAPVYALTHFDAAHPDFVPLKAVMVACKLLVLALSLRRELSLPQRLALLALLGLNRYTLWGVDSVLSEPPFELLLYLALWLIQSAESARSPGRRLLLFAAAGLAAYLVYAARTAGLVLMVALVATPLLRILLTRWSGQQVLPSPLAGEGPGARGLDGQGSAPRPAGGLPPILAAIAIFVVLAVLQAACLPSPRQYGDLLRQSTFRLLPLVSDYLVRWSAFWSNGCANSLKLAAIPLFAA